MMIALVRWFIKPGCEEDFIRAWQTLEPKDTSGFLAEFLSEPMPSDKITAYETDDLQPESGEYVPFVNIGIWRDEATFQAVIKPNDRRELKPFEVKLPTRTILTARDQHIGDWSPEILAHFQQTN